jgi:SAM-dependent methyltransferase
VVNDDQDSINKRVFHRPGIEKEYAELDLRPAETMALLLIVHEFRHDDILDLGVGAGRTGRYLATIAKRYECLDYSPVMIAHLRKTLPALSPRQSDMRDLSEFADASFDFTLASGNVIDVVSHADRLRVLSEVRRLLRPGGVFLFSSHNRNYFRALSGPRLELSRNPVNQALNVVRFVRQTVNHTRIAKHRQTERVYALLDDPGHDYSLLHYYVDRASQRAQLKDAGFDLVHAIDHEVRALADEDDDSRSTSIHYIARRL